MFDPLKVRLGIAPIAWTNDDLPYLGKENTFEQCISEMALSGFQGCEVGNKYPRDIPTLTKKLALRGLTIANAWFSAYLTTKPYEETEADFRKHLTFLRAMGAKIVGVSEQGRSIQGLQLPIFEKKPVMNAQEWALLCEGLNRLGRIALEYGITLTYHHHMGTVIQTGEEIDRLMESTDPGLVGLLFDSGHLAYCDEDGEAVLRKHIARVRHVHLKDIRPEVIKTVRKERKSFLDGVRMGAFTVPGDGAIHFEPLFRLLDAYGYAGWMIVEAEQDPAIADPLEYAIRARRYIREKTGL